MTENTIKSLIIQSQSILANLLESEGEISPELESLINNHEVQLNIKADNLAFCLFEIEDSIARLKRKENEIYEARKTVENGLKRFEDRIKGFMREIEKDSISGEIYSLSFRKSSGRVVIDNQDLIPESFIKTIVKKEANKTLIKDAIDVGIEVPGARVEYEPTLNKTINKK